MAQYANIPIVVKNTLIEEELKEVSIETSCKYDSIKDIIITENNNVPSEDILLSSLEFVCNIFDNIYFLRSLGILKNKCKF